MMIENGMARNQGTEMTEPGRSNRKSRSGARERAAVPIRKTPSLVKH
jgi:hypothetical protein